MRGGVSPGPSGFGVSSKERGARTDQSLEIIRRALSGETVTFKSDFFDFGAVVIDYELQDDIAAPAFRQRFMTLNVEESSTTSRGPPS